MSQNSSKINILLVEDDEHLAVILCDFLRWKGYTVILSHDGQQAFDFFRNHQVHLCILDVMLPKKDGFTLAAQIRELSQTVPIIFLTARSLEKDLIHGFRLGCDDYITKPFNPNELEYRIKAVLKRCNTSSAGSSSSGIITFGNNEFDLNNLTLRINNQQFHLTRKEAQLLHLLLERRNQVVSRQTAGELIWKNYNYFVGRSMDVFISRLRKYLSADPSIAIVNIHGTGFKLLVPESDQQDKK